MKHSARVRTRAAALLLSVCAVLMLLPLSLTVSAYETLTETVNLQRQNKNDRGPGYYFHNPSNTLTLTDLHVDTGDTYGLKLKIGTTVVLEGNNVIKAADIAVFCPGGFKVKGSGSLTLVSGGRGIVINTNDTADKMSWLEGTLDITSEKEAIYSTDAGCALAGGSVSLHVGDKSVNAVDVRSLTVSGGTKLTADSSLRGFYKLHITAANLDVASQMPALQGDGIFMLENMKLSTGDDYHDENALTASSTVKNITGSVVFGENVSVAADYVLLAAAVLVLAAIVVVPVLRHRRKIERLRAAGLVGTAAEKKKAAAKASQKK